MIKLTGINKKFGSEICLENIDLEISDSTFTALTGKSGSGKTTLLKIIGGLEHPPSGTVAYDGVFINEMSEERSSFFAIITLALFFRIIFLRKIILFLKMFLSLLLFPEFQRKKYSCLLKSSLKQ